MKLHNRINVILTILSLTVSVFIFYSVMEKIDSGIQYTTYAHTEVVGDKIYYSQNMAGQGLIFKMNSRGTVSHVFSASTANAERIQAISGLDDKLYAVVSAGRVEEDSDKNNPVFYTEYRIICLDSDFDLESWTNTFRLDDDLRLSGFSAEATGLFLTTIQQDGAALKVLSIDHGQLVPANQDPAESITMEHIRNKKSSSERFFVQARYRFGELEIRTDKDEPTESFRNDLDMELLVKSMRLSLPQLFLIYRNYVIWYIAAVLIWIIVLQILIRALSNRNRIVYMLVVAEIALALIIGTGVYTIGRESIEARKIEHSRFAVISLLGLADEAGISDKIQFDSDDFFDTDAYQTIRKEMVSFLRRDGNDSIFYDVMVVRLLDGKVCASGSGRNKEQARYLYGDGLDDLTVQVMRGNRYAVTDLVIDNQKYTAVAVTDSGTIHQYTLIGIINRASADARVWVDNRAMVVIFILCFAVGSLLILIAWYLQSRDFRMLEQALSDLALGRGLRQRPVTVGNDLKDMWDSLSEIEKRVEEIQYSKLRIMEAYYRFAPKNIEKILNKHSITEVTNSESIKTKGTCATLIANQPINTSTKRLKFLFRSIGDYQKEHNCIIIGKSTDLTRVDLFFHEEENQVLEYLTEMIHESMENPEGCRISGMMFFDECEFGVVGTEEEAATFLKMQHKETIHSITEIIAGMKLGLVVTGVLVEKENIKSPLRFIGMLRGIRNVEPVKLYEVLDAYPVKQRTMKIETMDRFNDALNLYYEKDFYFARTEFSELLRDVPDDELIKYYLFESDRCLNEGADGDDYKFLKL